VLRTLKHGQNRTSCVLDKRYAEQQCCRYSRQRRKFAPPGASQKKGTISEFPTKGYPPNLRVVELVRLSAPLLLPQHQQLTTTTLWFAAAAEIIPIDLRSNLAILIFPARAAPMLEDAEDYYAATATTSAGMGTVFVTH
jgi:hypothetical protein